MQTVGINTTLRQFVTTTLGIDTLTHSLTHSVSRLLRHACHVQERFCAKQKQKCSLRTRRYGRGATLVRKQYDAQESATDEEWELEIGGGRDQL